MAYTKSDLYFRHPNTIMVSGPTQSGKTWFVKKVLEQKLIRPFPTRIVWVFKDWQPLYDELQAFYPHIEFIKGYNDKIYEDFDPLINNLLVIDDQMENASNANSLSTLFTVGSHHRNLTVIYLVQYQYTKGKSTRSVGLNTHYNVIFRNNGDLTQTETVFRRRVKRNSKWLSEAFDDATSVPHGYIILDNRQGTPPQLRIRTGILDGETAAIYEEA